MKYKVEITAVVPDISKDELYSMSSYMGISMNNPIFRSDKIDYVFTWIGKRFPECTIIIGDYLNRFNVGLFEDDSNSQDPKALGAQGRRMSERIERIVSRDAERFKILDWESVLDDQALRIKQCLIQNRSRYEIFFNTITISAERFIDRQIAYGRRLAVTYEQAVSRSVEYIVEEVSVFDGIARAGSPVQIYPGTQLEILKLLATGSITVDVLAGLSSGVCVDLRAKRQA